MGREREGDFTAPRGSSGTTACLLAVGRHRVVAGVRRTLAGPCSVTAGGRTVVGVSGGPDSLALLAALAAIAARSRRSGYRIEPFAVHVHHHLRRDADDDASVVVSACRRLGVPLAVRHVHPGSLPGSVAANARRLRYDALADAARSVEAGTVAVAQHAEDQLETLLMAICRGSGLDGLRGMPWRRPLRDDVVLVRPLLFARKADAEALCRVAGLEWCTDAGNLDQRTVRGRLRRQVMPVLETLWPGAATRAAGTAESVASAVDLIEGALEQLPQDEGGAWSRDDLRALPSGAVGLVLRRAARRLAPACADRLRRQHLLEAAALIQGSGRARLDWPAGLRFIVERRRVRLERGESGT